MHEGGLLGGDELGGDCCGLCFFVGFGGLQWLGGSEGILIDLECGHGDFLGPPMLLDSSGLEYLEG